MIYWVTTYFDPTVVSFSPGSPGQEGSMGKPKIFSLYGERGGIVKEINERSNKIRFK
jgi:hypothetical protein